MKNKKVIIFLIVMVFVIISFSSCSQETKTQINNWLLQTLDKVTVLELILIIGATNLITRD